MEESLSLLNVAVWEEESQNEEEHMCTVVSLLD